MESRTTPIQIVLRRCRFVASARELEQTLPGVAEVLPPPATLSFVGSSSPGRPAYPVVGSPRLIELLTHFLAEQVELARDPATREDVRRPRNLDAFQQEPYFAEMADLAAKARAHGTVLRLDSLLWIHLADLVARLLNPSPAFLDGLRERSSGIRDEALHSLSVLAARDNAHDAERVAIRLAVLQGLATRNEFANRTISRLVGDQRPNPLHTAMVSNRLAYMLPPRFLTEFHPRPLAAVKEYGLSATRIGELFAALRLLIEDLFRHREERAQSGTEQYFVSQFLGEEAIERIGAIPLDRFAGSGRLADAERDRQLAFQVGWSLVFHDDVLRYLLGQLEQLNLRRALSRHMGEFSKSFLGELGSADGLRQQQGAIRDLARDLRALDVFGVLRGLLVEAEPTRAGYRVNGRELRRSVVPLDLSSYYELYRRNRRGTAVFIDLIGFTARTRELFFGDGATSSVRDVDVQDRGELAALALERLFRVRDELPAFDGSAEGFEGDAILDMFGDPLNALRYVARFRTNFEDNREFAFRPFSRPVPNPFAQDGFRVGIATGEYARVNIPDRGPDGEAQERLRSIGPAINKASRLNTGKRGGQGYLLSGAAAGAVEDVDPLGLQRVWVRDEVLDNTGICVDRATFDELCQTVREARLPYWKREGRASFELEGHPVAPRFYRFDLVFHDEEGGWVFALRRLPQVPKLKGIDRADSVLFEVLVFAVDEYVAFLDRDAQAATQAQESRRSSADSLGELESVDDSGGHHPHLSSELPDYLFDRGRTTGTDHALDGGGAAGGMGEDQVATERYFEGAADAADGVATGTAVAEYDAWQALGGTGGGALEDPAAGEPSADPDASPATPDERADEPAGDAEQAFAADPIEAALSSVEDEGSPSLEDEPAAQDPLGASADDEEPGFDPGASLADLGDGGLDLESFEPASDRAGAPAVDGEGFGADAHALEEDSDGGDSSLEQWVAGSQRTGSEPVPPPDDEAEPRPALPDVGDEELDDAELQAYLSDFLERLDGDEDDADAATPPAAGSGHDADAPLAPPGAADATEPPPRAAAPAPPADEEEGSDEWGAWASGADASLAPFEEPPPPASAFDAGADRDPAPSTGGFAGMRDEGTQLSPLDAAGDGPTPLEAFAASEAAPAPAADPVVPFASPPPAVSESLLGELGDDLVERLRAVRAAAAGGSTITPAELPTLLGDYQVAVRPLDGEHELWFGKRVGDALVDLHRYVVPAHGGGIDLDQALRLFLEDKRRSGFAGEATDHVAVPVDASPPAPLPIDQAQRILGEMLS